MNYELNRQPLRSLVDKLQLIAEGAELDLTPEEALIYGVDDADEFPEETTKRKEASYGNG